MEAGKFRIFQDRPAGLGLRTIAAVQVKGCGWQNSVLLREVIRILFKPSAGWIRPTCIREGNLFY